MAFTKAIRQIVAPKIAIQGVSGSGKTYSALRFARGFVGKEGKIALIDTENGSASLYSELTDFDVQNIAPKVIGGAAAFWWQDFMDAISEAINAKYDILIIDSASHIWQGVLDFKTRLDQKGGNSFVNWGNAGQQFSNVLNLILQSPIPVICCMRSKTEYVLEETERNGKLVNVPKKVGMAPITRGDSEYEFSVVFEVNRLHKAEISKSRCQLYDNDWFEQITEETGKIFKDWCSNN